MQKFTHKMGGRAQPPLVYINKDTLAQYIHIHTYRVDVISSKLGQ